MTEMNEKDLMKIIRDLRTKWGLSQEQFAAKVGVTFSTVNRWENGRGTPSPLAMRRIEELRDEYNQSRIKSSVRRKKNEI